MCISLNPNGFFLNVLLIINNFLKDKNSFVSAAVDTTARLWDIKSGKCIQVKNSYLIY